MPRTSESMVRRLQSGGPLGDESRHLSNRRLRACLFTLLGVLFCRPGFAQSCDPILNWDVPDREYEFVDLSDYVNTAKDAPFWTKNYDALEPGSVVISLYGRIPFKIAKGKDDPKDIMVMLGGGDSVTIDFDAKAETIYFFGHTHANLPLDETHGKYVIRYEDGTERQIELDGRHASDGWNIDDHCCNYQQQPTTLAKTAWPAASGKPALIREFHWSNPEPEKLITEIDFVDYQQPAGTPNGERHPMLFAITYSDVMTGTEVELDQWRESHYYWLEEGVDVILSRKSSTCPLLTLYNEEKRFVVMAHASQSTDAKGSVKVMVGKANKAGVRTEELEAVIAGGVKSNTPSPCECLRAALIRELEDLDIIVTDKGYTPKGGETEAWAGFYVDEFFYCDREEAEEAELPDKTEISVKQKILPKSDYIECGTGDVIDR